MADDLIRARATPRQDDQPPRLLYVATVAATVRGFLQPYAEHFRALGWTVDAAASGMVDDANLRAAFDNVYELPLSRSIADIRGMARAERALTRLLAASPNIVHVHTPIAGFLTRLAVRRLPAGRRPAVIYTAHGFHFHRQGHPATNALFLAMERLAGRWTDRLIVINDEDEAAARHHRIVGPDRLIRLPGIGIDTEVYATSSVSSADRLGAAGALRVLPGSPMFVAIGELNRNKRPQDIVAALAAMRHREAVLVLVGDGPERARLETLVAANGLTERVRFAGQVGDVRPILASAKGLVLASRREGLPRSIMEGMAFEVPVVATDARGNRELVGSDGFVVPIGDVAGLASSMDKILDDPANAAAMGQRGRSRMVREYGLPNVIRRHEEIYRTVLAERASTR